MEITIHLNHFERKIKNHEQLLSLGFYIFKGAIT